MDDYSQVLGPMNPSKFVEYGKKGISFFKKKFKKEKEREKTPSPRKSIVFDDFRTSLQVDKDELNALK